MGQLRRDFGILASGIVCSKHATHRVTNTPGTGSGDPVQDVKETNVI
jgi:hypothetical protein